MTSRSLYRIVIGIVSIALSLGYFRHDDPSLGLVLASAGVILLIPFSLSPRWLSTPLGAFLALAVLFGGLGTLLAIRAAMNIDSSETGTAGRGWMAAITAALAFTGAGYFIYLASVSARRRSRDAHSVSAAKNDSE